MYPNVSFDFQLILVLVFTMKSWNPRRRPWTQVSCVCCPCYHHDSGHDWKSKENSMGNGDKMTLSYSRQVHKSPREKRFFVLFNFIKSKKVWRHICKGYRQNGKIIFLDGTHTFASILLCLLSTNKEIDLSFDNALEIALKLTEEKKSLPVIVNASIGSYNQSLLAFVVPIRLKYFLKWFSQDTSKKLPRSREHR